MYFILALKSTDPGISKDYSCIGSFKSTEVCSIHEVVNFLQPATHNKCRVEICFGPKLFPNSSCVCAAFLELSTSIFHITLNR